MSSDAEDNAEDFSKSSMNLKQSNSFGNLTDSSRTLEHGFNIDTTTMKRNKSFWRFSKSEDILEGMALWKHRDLVPIDVENADKEMTLKKQDKQVKKMDTLQKKKKSRIEDGHNKTMDVIISNENNKRGNDFGNRTRSFNGNYNKDHKNNFMHRDGDEIYDESPKRRNDKGPSKSQSQKAKYEKNNKNFADKRNSRDVQDTNFYDDEVMVIKTVKRKEILKQYYSSGTDTELSSDPYDCIIVDDHLVPTTSTFRNRNSYAGEPDKRNSVYKNDVAATGTLLPRTKLSKSGRNDSSEQFEINDSRMNTAKSSNTASRSNFGPWSNLWPDEKPFN